MDYKYKRVLIKISGEALGGQEGRGLDFDTIAKVAKQIKQLSTEGVQIGIIVGGGNFWRGREGRDMDRATADHMGMLATVINALALQSVLETQNKIETRVMSALTITRVAEPYIQRKAIKHLENGYVVIFACGTGNPFFSTDTGAALRAAEINADIILLAKNIDGVYSADPKLDKSAVKYDKMTHFDVLQNRLNVMDLAAVSLCMENKIPVLVFALKEENSIIRACMGEHIGTLIE